MLSRSKFSVLAQGEAVTDEERFSNLLQVANIKGQIEATRLWAHWKDGVQYVGSCGTTLEKALAPLELELLVLDEKKYSISPRRIVKP